MNNSSIKKAFAKECAVRLEVFKHSTVEEKMAGCCAFARLLFALLLFPLPPPAAVPLIPLVFPKEPKNKP